MIGLNREGYPYVFIPAGLAAVLGHFRRKKIASFSLFASLACAYFFRDPDRYPPNDRELLVSPADGKIISIRHIKKDPWLEEEAYQVSIFMSIFDVHVNRSPITGKILDIQHQAGAFRAANKKGVFEQNEKLFYFLERIDGLKVLMVQVAGLIARRTVPFVKIGEEILAGERIGMIRFGSRVDIFVPATKAKLLLGVGHKVRAGETPIFWIPLEKKGV